MSFLLQEQMFRRILIFVLFCISSLSGTYAQYDPQYSQSVFNKLAVNPGTAGAADAINLVALNRNQWSGVMGLKTTVFSGDMPIKLFGLNSGVGINFINNEIGNFTNLLMQLNYASRYELEKGTLALGLSVGLINQKLSADWVLPSQDVFDQSDPHIPQAEVSGSAFDVGFGAFYEEEKYYAGVSISHLNGPKPNFKEEFNYKVSGTLYLAGGYNHKVQDTDYEIMPSIFYKTDGRVFQLDLSTLVRYKKRYWGGLTYRFQDAIVLLGGIEMKNGVRFGYSYDVTTSAISTAGKGGTHELMIGYNLDINFEKRTKRYKSVRYL